MEVKHIKTKCDRNGTNWQIEDISEPDTQYCLTHQDGSREWFYNGKFHRIDGYAIEPSYGSCEYYIDGLFVKDFLYASVVALWKKRQIKD